MDGLSRGVLWFSCSVFGSFFIRTPAFVQMTWHFTKSVSRLGISRVLVAPLTLAISIRVSEQQQQQQHLYFYQVSTFGEHGSHSLRSSSTLELILIFHYPDIVPRAI